MRTWIPVIWSQQSEAQINCISRKVGIKTIQCGHRHAFQRHGVVECLERIQPALFAAPSSLTMFSRQSQFFDDDLSSLITVASTPTLTTTKISV